MVATEVGDVRAMLPPEQGDWLVEVHPKAEERTVPELARRLERGDRRSGEATAAGIANRARVEAAYTFEATCAAYSSSVPQALTA